MFPGLLAEKLKVKSEICFGFDKTLVNQPQHGHLVGLVLVQIGIKQLEESVRIFPFQVLHEFEETDLEWLKPILFFMVSKVTVQLKKEMLVEIM